MSDDDPEIAAAVAAPGADKTEAELRRTALRFVVLMGVTSLFADMTHEGAPSTTGPFLGLFGASGALVSSIAGLGELVGYGLRLLSGYVADRRTAVPGPRQIVFQTPDGHRIARSSLCVPTLSRLIPIKPERIDLEMTQRKTARQ